MSTGSIKISKSVKTLGTLVGVIGGAISIAALSGVAIATSTIASTVGHWASAVGLGTIAAGTHLMVKFNLSSIVQQD